MLLLALEDKAVCFTLATSGIEVVLKYVCINKLNFATTYGIDW